MTEEKRPHEMDDAELIRTVFPPEIVEELERLRDEPEAESPDEDKSRE